MKKILIFGIVLLLIGMSVIPPTGGIGEERNSLTDNKIKVTSDETSSVNEDTEYFVAMGMTR